MILCYWSGWFSWERRYCGVRLVESSCKGEKIATDKSGRHNCGFHRVHPLEKWIINSSYDPPGTLKNKRFCLNSTVSWKLLSNRPFGLKTLLINSSQLINFDRSLLDIYVVVTLHCAHDFLNQIKFMMNFTKNTENRIPLFRQLSLLLETTVLYWQDT